MDTPETHTTLGTRQQDNTKHRKLKWRAIPTYQIRKITMTGRFFFSKTLVWEKTIFDTRYILAYACLLTYRHNVPNCQANLFWTYWRNLKCRLQTGYGYIEDRHVCFSYRYAYIIYINKQIVTLLEGRHWNTWLFCYCKIGHLPVYHVAAYIDRQSITSLTKKCAQQLLSISC